METSIIPLAVSCVVGLFLGAHLWRTPPQIVIVQGASQEPHRRSVLRFAPLAVAAVLIALFWLAQL